MREKDGEMEKGRDSESKREKDGEMEKGRDSESKRVAAPSCCNALWIPSCAQSFVAWQKSGGT